jgi:predicted transcriptional regulator
MVHEAELSTFDLRYENYRMKNPALEARLLASIMERGIEEPLEGVDVEEKKILLNGFKRLRCARKLRMGYVPYASLGNDEATGILAVIRASNQRSLTILEQARFIGDLRDLHKMTVAAIAETLSRSKAWVSMRLGLLGEMGETIREKILSGAFPVYSYMYTLRPFMRMNGEGRRDVEAFVGAVAGKKRSVREIEQLAHGYFRGPEWFRREVQEGNLALVLERMKRVPDAPEGTNGFERVLLGDLEIVGKYMQRTAAKSQDPRIQTRTFCAQANLLLAGILSRLSAFVQAMRSLHDRTGKASSDLPPRPGGDERPGDRPAAQSKPQGDPEDHPSRRGGPATEPQGEDPDRPRPPPAAP